jgi:hypothetical protein
MFSICSWSLNRVEAHVSLILVTHDEALAPRADRRYLSERPDALFATIHDLQSPQDFASRLPHGRGENNARIRLESSQSPGLAIGSRYLGALTAVTAFNPRAFTPSPWEARNTLMARGPRRAYAPAAAAGPIWI